MSYQIKLNNISLMVEFFLYRILTLTKKKTTAITFQPLNRTYEIIVERVKETKHYDLIKVSYQLSEN